MFEQLISKFQEKLRNLPQLSFAKSVLYGAPNMISNLATPCILVNLNEIAPVPQGATKTVIEATFDVWLYSAVLGASETGQKAIQKDFWFYDASNADSGLYPALLSLRNKVCVTDARGRQWFCTGLGEPKFFSQQIDKNATGGCHIQVVLSCCVMP